MSGPAVVWFRRDLRLGDHPALLAALAEHGDVVPLFVRDPDLVGRSGAPRLIGMDMCVDALHQATGGALAVRHGEPAVVVPAVAAEVGADAVYVSRDFTPYGRRRDAEVADRLAGAGVGFRGVGSPYVVEPGTVRKADGGSYAVFTAFRRAWRACHHDRPAGPPDDPDWITVRSEPAVPVERERVVDVPITESAALERLAAFVTGPLGSYADGRNHPAADGTSRLSAALKWGTVHPRQVLAAVETSGDGTDPNRSAFVSELVWREFYADVLFRRPDTVQANLVRAMDDLAVDTDAAARERFRAWCAGRTGFPIVDAGMRQLAAIGWMHNRVRMITASFLVKDLHLPWQWGARYFMQHLVDGDVASNTHNWQWVAGTGTDAAPYFRVFNPSAQAERYDPDGDYVATWAGDLGTAAAPEPIVDHATERAEALARYNTLRNR